MIKCTTQVDEKLIMQFNLYSIRKKMWLPLSAFAFLAIVGIICCFNENLGVVGGVVLICIGALLPVVYWFAFASLCKRMVKKSVLLQSEMVQHFTFDDKIYISETSKYVKKNDMEFAFELVYKAVEVDNAFYLYINKVQAFMVNKSGFTEGDAKDLHILLFQNIPQKKFKFSKRLYA